MKSAIEAVTFMLEKDGCLEGRRVLHQVAEEGTFYGIQS